MNAGSKLKSKRDYEVAEYKTNEQQCELSKAYIYENEIPNRNNLTLLGKEPQYF